MWPLAARAQQVGMKRIGVLMNYASTDSEGQVLLAEFTRHLAKLGWTEGRNVQIDEFFCECPDPAGVTAAPSKFDL